MYVNPDYLGSVDDKGVAEYTIYAKVEEYSFKLKISNNISGIATTYYNNGQTFKITDKIPEDIPVKRQFAYDFADWEYYKQEGTYVPVIPGETTFEDARIMHDHDGGFYAEVLGKWTPKEFTINFHLNNGAKDVVQKYVCKQGDAKNTSLDVNEHFGVVSNNSSFTDKSLQFSGWALHPKGDVIFDKGLSAEAIRKYAEEQEKSSIDVYAKWEGSESYLLEIRAFTPEEYAKINMDEESFDGSDYDITQKEDLIQTDESYLNETVILSGTEYVRQGYTLTGWTYIKTVDGNTTTRQLKATDTIKETVAPQSAVLTANWKMDSYTVKYNFDGGKATSKDIKNVVTYSKVNTPSKTALYNYKKDGDDFDVKDVAEWEVVKPGYLFLGWNLNNSTYTYYGGDIYDNLTFTAVWFPIYYNVSVEGNGGSLILPNAEVPSVMMHVAYDETISLKGITPVREGYKFKNWLAPDEKTYGLNGVLKNLATESDATVKVKAQWTPLSNTITYDLDGGKLPKKDGKAQKNPAKYNTDEGTASLVEPEKSGYEFIGWVLTQKGVEPGQETAHLNALSDGIAQDSYGNVILTALYKPNTYNIEINMNLEGESEYKFQQEVVYDETVLFDSYAKELENNLSPAAQGERSIVSFTTGKNGKGKKYNLTSAYSKLEARNGGTVTLYAQWSNKKVYRILYDLDGGTIKKRVAAYTPSAVTKIGVPSKKGYTFTGWTVHNVAETETAFVPGAEVNPEEFIYKNEAQKSVTIEKDDKNKIDIYLVAHFEPISYDVTIDGKLVGKYSYDTEEWYNYTESKDGYEYAGVFTAKNGKGTRVDEVQYTLSPELDVRLLFAGLGTKNGMTVKLYAYWKPKTLGVDYSVNGVVRSDGGGATVVDVANFIAMLPTKYKSFVVGKGIALPKLSAPGYTFLGWKVAKDEYPFYEDTVPAGYDLTVSKGYVTKINKGNKLDVRLTPCFSENLYSIKLNLGGGFYKVGSKKYSGSYQVADELLSIQDAENAYYKVQGISIGNIQKKGYRLKGLYLDSKGTEELPGYSGGYKGIVTKNKGVLNIYAVWEKISLPKPDKISAKLSDNKLEISIKDDNAANASYSIEYSTSMLFTKGATQTVNMGPYYGGKVSVSGATGTRYYVRARAYVYDSTHEIRYGSYSRTIRANKTDQE